MSYPYSILFKQYLIQTVYFPSNTLLRLPTTPDRQNTPAPRLSRHSTALHFCVESNLTTLAAELVNKHDADPTIRDMRGQAPIELARSLNRAQAFEMLDVALPAVTFDESEVLLFL